MGKKVDIMHVFYWSIIFIGIQILVYAFVGDHELVSTLGFAATLISILVGLLALSISLYQGLTQSSSMKKMEDASDRIQAVTSSLEDAKLADLFNDIKTLFIEADFKGLRQDVKTSLNRNYTIETGSESALELDKEFVRLIYLDGEYELNFGYALYKGFTQDKAFDISKLANYIVEKDSEKDVLQDAFYKVEQNTVFLNSLRRFSKLKSFSFETLEKGKFNIRVTKLEESIVQAVRESANKNEFQKYKHIIDDFFKE